MRIAVYIRNRSMALQRLLVLFISIVIFVMVWWFISWFTHLPDFILPSPQRVLFRFWDILVYGKLLYHAVNTLSEVMIGLLVGTIMATCLGYLIAQYPTFEQLVGPYLVASQAVPTVAIAPLLIIWFGAGLVSKIVICALVVFFPMLINTFIGFRSVSKDLYILMYSLKASKWQIFTLLEVPAALPVLFGGLRIGATLSVIGAVVGEFVGADRGLGFLISVARGQYDTALVFVAVFVLIIMALMLYGLVTWLEVRFLNWMH